MQILHLTGRPHEMGEAFGESCRDQIRELYELRLRNALAQALRYGGRRADEAELLDLVRLCWRETEAFDPEGAAELAGIARGAGLSRERILAMNGLTDLRDALAWPGQLEAVGGCTSCIAQRDTTDAGVLYAQTWDLSTDNAPFVVGVHRRPSDAPQTWSVTTVGCLSLMGLNAAGVGIGTTNLRTLDARPGVPYLSIIHRALACSDAREATRVVERARRAGGHSYSLVDAGGTAVVVECTAAKSRVLPIERGTHVHCNHCLVDEHAALEGDTPQASSRAREARMSELLATSPGKLDPPTLQRFLADEAGGELAIQRDDFSGISTNAAVVIDPSKPALLACHGLPREGAWHDLVRAPEP